MDTITTTIPADLAAEAHELIAAYNRKTRHLGLAKLSLRQLVAAGLQKELEAYDSFLERTASKA